MIFIHFPCIEAGLVRSLCGAVHAHVQWTTTPEKVSCPRCTMLLRKSDGDTLDRAARRPPLSAEAGRAPKPNLTAETS